MPSVEQRQLDIFARGSARQEIEALKNEPEFAVADIGQLIAIQVRNVRVIEQILAARRAIETAKNIHQGRFARAARAHQSDEFAAPNLERHAAHGVHFHFAGAIGFVNVDQFNDGAVVHPVDLPVSMMGRLHAKFGRHGGRPSIASMKLMGIVAVRRMDLPPAKWQRWRVQSAGDHAIAFLQILPALP